MTEFIQKMTTDAVEAKCKLNNNSLGHKYGFDNSEVPFTEVGVLGVYKINVRYYKTINTKPSWGFSLTSDGGMLNKGEFASCQDAIDACVKAAKLKVADFYENHPHLL
ncbi:MAG: hypothetical protein RLZZ546_2003 [Bacteroidota bacterium]|jgi:hypothetical protein